MRSKGKFGVGAVGLGFASWAGQIGHNFASDLPSLRYFLELRGCVAQALSRREGLRHSLHASAQYCEYNENLIFLPEKSIFVKFIFERRFCYL